MASVAGQLPSPLAVAEATNNAQASLHIHETKINNLLIYYSILNNKYKSAVGLI